ncbi:MAG: ACT domain-containing protein [Oscillospiraceae bacterium]
MGNLEQYIVVDAEVLPEVFHKVMEAKSLLAKGIAKSSSDACKMVGISRGTFYKYKDRMFIYSERMSNEILTLQLVLEDEPGILSAVLSGLYKLGANILTVNQNIPNDKVAAVTISIRIPDPGPNIQTVTDCLGMVNGVVEVKLI